MGLQTDPIYTPPNSTSITNSLRLTFNVTYNKIIIKRNSNNKNDINNKNNKNNNNNNNSNNNISNAVVNNNSNNIRNNVNSGASSAVNKDANVRVYLYRFYESRLKEERELRKMMKESLIEKLKEVEMLCPVWPRNCIFFSSYSR